MPQLFPNALKYFKEFELARREKYKISWDDFNPRAGHGYGYKQIDEDDREELFGSIKDLRFYLGGDMRELLVPEEHATPQRAVACIVEYREYVKKDLKTIEALAKRYPQGRDQPLQIRVILDYEREVIEMLDYILGMEEVKPYITTVDIIEAWPEPLYCIVQDPDDSIVLHVEPHFGVDNELMLLIGRKFLEGGGAVKYGGRTYEVSEAIFIVFEVNPEQVGTTPKAVRTFFLSKAKERSSTLFHRCTEDLLREFGREVTNEVLTQLKTVPVSKPTAIAPPPRPKGSTFGHYCTLG